MNLILAKQIQTRCGSFAKLGPIGFIASRFFLESINWELL